MTNNSYAYALIHVYVLIHILNIVATLMLSYFDFLWPIFLLPSMTVLLCLGMTLETVVVDTAVCSPSHCTYDECVFAYVFIHTYIYIYIH